MTAIVNIDIDQGATYRETITIHQSGTLNQDEVDRLTAAEVAALGVVNLTGATIEGKIRERFDDISSLADFVIDNRDDVNGTFDMSLTYQITDALDFNRAFYDIEITYSATDRQRELSGIVRLIRGVTT